MRARNSSWKTLSRSASASRQLNLRRRRHRRHRRVPSADARTAGLDGAPGGRGSDARRVVRSLRRPYEKSSERWSRSRTPLVPPPTWSPAVRSGTQTLVELPIGTRSVCHRDPESKEKTTDGEVETSSFCVGRDPEGKVEDLDVSQSVVPRDIGSSKGSSPPLEGQ